MLEICSDLSKTDLKIYYFCQHSKKAKKWQNGQTILFLANSFKKAKWQPWFIVCLTTLKVIQIKRNTIKIIGKEAKTLFDVKNEN